MSYRCFNSGVSAFSLSTLMEVGTEYCAHLYDQKEISKRYALSRVHTKTLNVCYLNCFAQLPSYVLGFCLMFSNVLGTDFFKQGYLFSIFLHYQLL